MESIKTEEDVEKYLQWWQAEINATIAGIDINRSIEDFPNTQAAFEGVKRAWRKAFKEPTWDNITARDKAMQKLGEEWGLENSTNAQGSAE